MFHTVVAIMAIVRECIIGLEVHMAAQGYAPESIRTLGFTWSRLARYAESEELTVVARTWVKKYMDEHFGENGKPLTACYRNYYRAANMLCDYAEYGYVQRGRNIVAETPIRRQIEAAKAKMEERSYSSKAIVAHLCVWHTIARYAEQHGHSALSWEWVDHCVREHYGSECHKTREHWRAARVLLCVVDTGCIPSRKHMKRESFPKTYDCLFAAKEQYIANRQLRASSARQMDIKLRHFAGYLEAECLRVGQLTVADIRKYLLTLTCYARKTIAYAHYALRSILHTAFKNGATATDLSLLCETVRTAQDAKIPAAYSTSDVEAILNSTDRGTAVGKRDYAVLLLAARLGIRAGDIRALKLEHLCWDTSEIRFIQSKTQNEIVLPMSAEIGWALIDYLKNSRPSTNCKSVFVRMRAPFEPLGATCNLWHVVSKYFNAAQIHIPVGKRHGMHSLRSSLASNMLSGGTPLPVISEVLGHANTTSTRQYLKIDIGQLRQCALEVELGGGVHGLH